MSRPSAVRFSKRELGEGYIAGVSVVFAGVLAGILAMEGLRFGPRVAVGSVPVVALVAVGYWLDRLDLDSDQVWHVAECAALGTGLVTLLLVGGHLLARVLTVSTEFTVVLVVLVATTTVGGALVGIAWELHDSSRRLSHHNAVFYRVLRYYLRNDMTVVLATLDDVKSSVDGPEHAKIEAAEQKIESFLSLTDTVCRVDIENGGRRSVPVDLAALVDQRVRHFRQVRPELDLVADLPETARASADEQIGLVVDTVVESALRYSTGHPELRVEVDVDGDDVVLRFEDCGETIPDADLSMLATGDETAFDQGRGVELWLTYWLVARNGGDVTVETGGDARRIEITLERARARKRATKRARNAV